MAVSFRTYIFLVASFWAGVVSTRLSFKHVRGGKGEKKRLVDGCMNAGLLRPRPNFFNVLRVLLSSITFFHVRYVTVAIETIIIYSTELSYHPKSLLFCGVMISLHEVSEITTVNLT